MPGDLDFVKLGSDARADDAADGHVSTLTEAELRDHLGFMYADELPFDDKARMDALYDLTEGYLFGARRFDLGMS